METQIEKKTKQTQKKPPYAALCVCREIKRQIVTHLKTLNKKDFGRRLRAEDYLSLALSLVTPEHLEQH